MIKSVKMGKEIAVMATNKVGLLAKVGAVLADRGIDILAVSAQVAGGVAVLNLVVDEHLRACDLLRKKGFVFHESSVVLVKVEDKPGVLVRLTRQLAARKIDLLSLFGTSASTYEVCLLVLSTSNNQKAVVVLRSLK